MANAIKNNGGELSVAEIKELMAAMYKHRIGALELSREGFALKLESAWARQAAAGADGPTAAYADTRPAPREAPADEPEANAYTVVKSPIVGTYYEAPGPEQPPFVREGSAVKRGDVLFIIESMKLMNEVTAETDGTVRRILVQNAQGVEYGQPVMEIDA